VTLEFPIVPMKAGLGTLPVDDDSWAFEIKWDGYRMIAHIDGPRIKLQSTKGIDMIDRYPELRSFPTAVNAQRAIIDGEIVVLDGSGRPRFEMLQRHDTQVSFYAFDVLQVDGHDTIGVPYEQRRALLETLVEPGDNWTVPAHRVGGGADLLAATAERGLEGVMAKRLGSLYVPGKRSPNWRKVKNRTVVELVVGGFTYGSGSRERLLGALLVGVPEQDNVLRFAGGVGTGFDQATLESLTARLQSLAQPPCPFSPPPPKAVRREATWVSPTLRIRAEIAEFTNDGLVRHASYLGLQESSGAP
jgi:bifunctional non-homologous end joining protein LigD